VATRGWGQWHGHRVLSCSQTGTEVLPASNHDPPALRLPSSWDYRREPRRPSTSKVLVACVSAVWRIRKHLVSPSPSSDKGAMSPPLFSAAPGAAEVPAAAVLVPRRAWGGRVHGDAEGRGGLAVGERGESPALAESLHQPRQAHAVPAAVQGHRRAGRGRGAQRPHAALQDQPRR
jgi:hypothetical protein